MKAAVIKKPSIHAIPLIILAMLLLYSTSGFAYNHVGSGKFVTLAKGQAYIPPQHHHCSEG